MGEAKLRGTFWERKVKAEAEKIERRLRARDEAARSQAKLRKSKSALAALEMLAIAIVASSGDLK